MTASTRAIPHDCQGRGLRVDEELHPLDAEGRVLHPRIFAAGAAVGGHDTASDGTGMGVAMFTGWLAGRSAAGRDS